MTGLFIVAIGLVMMAVLAPFDLAVALVGGIFISAIGIVIAWIDLS